MNNKEKLEEAAKIHLNSGKIPNNYQSFITGGKSDAAKEYWFEKFQQEQDKNKFSALETAISLLKQTTEFEVLDSWKQKIRELEQFKNK
jgi:hypothetical protein